MQPSLSIPVAGGILRGDLALPPHPAGLVIFAHGSGSSRLSPRNQAVAASLRGAGLGTFLFDLLTSGEDQLDEIDGRYRFDIPLLSQRLAAVTRWAGNRDECAGLGRGFFGASTGAAAALVAAAELGETVQAVVSRGGRPDLAGRALGKVLAPTLLLVGGDDIEVLRLNRMAARQLRGPSKVVVIPGASHLFEEPGAMAQVARESAAWFRRHLHPPPLPPSEKIAP